MTAPVKMQRDALGQFCFFLHLAIVAFIILGWLMRAPGLLIFYLVFLPAVVVHWKLNGDACILNNLENWLRYRRWRAPDRNPEEGAWLRSLIRSLTGTMLGKGQMDVILYGAMALFWALAWCHLLRFQGS